MKIHRRPYVLAVFNRKNRSEDPLDADSFELAIGLDDAIDELTKIRMTGARVNLLTVSLDTLKRISAGHRAIVMPPGGA